MSVPSKDVQSEPALPQTVEDLENLVTRADAGDESVLPQVRKLLEEVPESTMRLFRGDPAYTNEFLMLNRIAGNNPARREATQHKLDSLRAELAGPNPSPLERLLVERCVACWVHVQRADLKCEHHDGPLPIRQLDFLGRQQDRSHRRLFQALKTLATVRKLALPALQVNVGRNQINKLMLQTLRSLEQTNWPLCNWLPPATARPANGIGQREDDQPAADISHTPFS